ncbi:hypothetical protein DPMN_178828 [Dreissena polymorpha]|uniref:Uncharacterized protein n=1 Tax=Dreissena polymorpha TaxID=45954 RepID=A0A9D4EF02_DREPO|nr:hypothetical protein DPMN_178828 [Dreissena polymorpha]
MKSAVFIVVFDTMVTTINTYLRKCILPILVQPELTKFKSYSLLAKGQKSLWDGVVFCLYIIEDSNPIDFQVTRIMKLHRKIDHDWQMTLIDFQVTRKQPLIKEELCPSNPFPYSRALLGVYFKNHI